LWRRWPWSCRHVGLPWTLLGLLPSQMSALLLEECSLCAFVRSAVRRDLAHNLLDWGLHSLLVHFVSLIVSCQVSKELAFFSRPVQFPFSDLSVRQVGGWVPILDRGNWGNNKSRQRGSSMLRTCFLQPDLRLAEWVTLLRRQHARSSNFIVSESLSSSYQISYDMYYFKVPLTTHGWWTAQGNFTTTERIASVVGYPIDKKPHFLSTINKNAHW
jgi:hypothetical protein